MVLTGHRGSGKTTLLKLLHEEIFKKKLMGLTTWAEPGKAVWMKDNYTEEVVQIGAFDPNVGKNKHPMRICDNGFAKFGINLLESFIGSEEEWISIDEVGFLETECEDYCNLLRHLMDEKRVLAVVRKEEIPFLTEICSREDAFVVDLDNPWGNVACVIMASGLGKRFGGNKLMADFLGNPMIQHIFEATEGMFSRRVVVTRHKDVEKLCKGNSIDVILHELPYRSDTVMLGMESIGTADGCMFCPADQPLIKAETIAELLLGFKDKPNNIWRTSSDGMVGAPVIFPRWAFEELKNLPEGKGGSWVIKKHEEKLSIVQVVNPYELMDVDTKEAFELLKQYKIDNPM